MFYADVFTHGELLVHFLVQKGQRGDLFDTFFDHFIQKIINNAFKLRQSRDLAVYFIKPVHKNLRDVQHFTAAVNS